MEDQRLSCAGDWRVEIICDDGEVEVAIFTGPRAEQRARLYDRWLRNNPITAASLPPRAFEKGLTNLRLVSGSKQKPKPEGGLIPPLSRPPLVGRED